MALQYQSGEEIKKGDRIRFHGEQGRIEFVAVAPGDSETDWYVKNEGEGVMILEPKHFGRVFLHRPERAEDLEFICRDESAS